MNRRAAAVIIKDDAILLVHRKKPDREYYVLPGGSIESSESPEQACIREVREETGLTITIVRLLCTLDNRGRTEHYFLAIPQGGTLALGEPERSRYCESNQYLLKWINLQDFQKINFQPEAMRKLCLACLQGTSRQERFIQ